MAKRQIKKLHYHAWIGVLLTLLAVAPAARAHIDVLPPVEQTQLPSTLEPRVIEVNPSVSLPKVAFGLLGATVLGAISGWQIAQRRRLQAVFEHSFNHIVVISTTCKTASVTWKVAPAVKRKLALQGQTLAVRLYTAIDPESTSPALITQLHCVEEGSRLQVPIPVSDRDYKFELGATSTAGVWHSLAWSAWIHIPACQPDSSLQVVEPELASAGEGNHPRFDPQNCLILTPLSSDDFYVSWRISREHREQALRQGGRKQMLRIHDVTGLDPGDRTAHKTHQYECNPKREDLHILISRRDRDYIAELGYITTDGQWLSLARSAVTRMTDHASPMSLRIPPTEPMPHPPQTSIVPLPEPQSRTRPDKP